MEFNAEEFIKVITWESFDELKKSDLMALAAYLGIEAKHAMRKQVIKKYDHWSFGYRRFVRWAMFGKQSWNFG